MNHTELRALMARMQEQIALVGGKSSPEDKKSLDGAWENLTSHMAVGPAPDTRECPSCKKTIMRAATLCGFCWTKMPESTHS